MRHPRLRCTSAADTAASTGRAAGCRRRRRRRHRCLPRRRFRNLPPAAATAAATGAAAAARTRTTVVLAQQPGEDAPGEDEEQADEEGDEARAEEGVPVPIGETGGVDAGRPPDRLGGGGAPEADRLVAHDGRRWRAADAGVLRNKPSVSAGPGSTIHLHLVIYLRIRAINIVTTRQTIGRGNTSKSDVHTCITHTHTHTRRARSGK